MSESPDFDPSQSPRGEGTAPWGKTRIKTIEQQYHEARTLALEVSKANDCAEHVNAIVAVVDGCPQVTRFEVSDWFSSDSTVATFVNGKERT